MRSYQLTKEILYKYYVFASRCVWIAIAWCIMGLDTYTPPPSEKSTMPARSLGGAWKMVVETDDPWEEGGGSSQIKLYSDDYFMLTVFDVSKQEFYGAGGGTYRLENGVYTEYIFFHSYDPAMAGRSYSFNIQGGIDQFRQIGSIELPNFNLDIDEEYARVDFNNDSPLTGAWELVRPEFPGETRLRLYTDSYFQEVTFDNRARSILSAAGGRYAFRGEEIRTTILYHKNDRSQVRNTVYNQCQYNGGSMVIFYRSPRGVIEQVWRRLD